MLQSQRIRIALLAAIVALPLAHAIQSPARADDGRPNSTDPTETWRTDYSDIGYPDVGFSDHIPGWINGYLTPQDYPDGKTVLPPPPVQGSAAQAADLEAFENYRAMRDTDLGRRAAADANLKFDNIGKPFSDALGIDISRETTPHLHLLLQRVLTDAAYASDSAKSVFKRPRPFTELKVASCTQEHEKFLSSNGSYPSGHAVTGMLWAAVLVEIAPDRATQLIKKGYEFGEGRAICGVHWRSDIEAGRLLAFGAFSRLQSDKRFQRQLREAKNEVADLRTHLR
ncbi:phosphatase PAP2 family protein (plasmid) [Rhizobium sp. NIBRBAC000502774]|nr:phosphatase PAP2 family protein [Rhizobium sp. NIBRBAC000502774]